MLQAALSLGERLPDVKEQGLSLQGLHAARQVWRGPMRARICLCQQGRQLVHIQAPVVRQVIFRQCLQLQKRKASQFNSLPDRTCSKHYKVAISSCFGAEKRVWLER